MQIKKNEVNKIFILFLFAHLIVWTLLPSLLNTNLPLDTIEAIAWGNGWPLGWDKHPPLSSWFPELFYQIFGNQDWAFYLLSQIFVVLSFVIVFIFSKDFFKDPKYSLISVLLLEGILFYNFTTPEFNVNVCPLPFWALTVYYFWKGLKQNDIIVWLLFGLFAAFGILSKYLFVYLLVAIDIFFIYIIAKKKFNYKCLISVASFFLIILPHFLWLLDNDFITIKYALFRSVDDPLSGFGTYKFLNHIFYPIIFLTKQIGILLPFFIMLLFLISRFKIKLNRKDKKLIFLTSITILPIILMFLTSLITGARIRTMGMAPFYLFLGVFFVYIFQSKIYLLKLKNFFMIFLFIFILSPTAYYLTSVKQKNERTDYPGKEISQIVQKRWNNNFSNEIEIVVGYGWIDGWYAQNLSYHLKQRPKWKSEINEESNKGIVWIKDFNAIKNCKGVFFQIEPLNDICMVGNK